MNFKFPYAPFLGLLQEDLSYLVRKWIVVYWSGNGLLFIGQEMDYCLLVRKWIVIYWSGNG